MASVFDVAKYILNKKGRMSTWKLQKLCYYSQAWSLAWTETPLFEEDFEAWKNGPVCRELFCEHKGLFFVSEDDLSKGDYNRLNSDQKETIDIVLRDYGNMEPFEVRELSHSEEPWINARKGIADDESCNNVISKSSMGNFYGSL